MCILRHHALWTAVVLRNEGFGANNNVNELQKTKDWLVTGTVPLCIEQIDDGTNHLDIMVIFPNLLTPLTFTLTP